MCYLFTILLLASIICFGPSSPSLISLILHCQLIKCFINCSDFTAKLSVIVYCCVYNSPCTSPYGTSCGHKSTYILIDVFKILASHIPPDLWWWVGTVLMSCHDCGWSFSISPEQWTLGLQRKCVTVLWTNQGTPFQRALVDYLPPLHRWVQCPGLWDTQGQQQLLHATSQDCGTTRGCNRGSMWPLSHYSPPHCFGSRLHLELKK